MIRKCTQKNDELKWLPRHDKLSRKQKQKSRTIISNHLFLLETCELLLLFFSSVNDTCNIYWSEREHTYSICFFFSSKFEDWRFHVSSKKLIHVWTTFASTLHEATDLESSSSYILKNMANFRPSFIFKNGEIYFHLKSRTKKAPK